MSWESAEPDFDVIVVGAGIAGSLAAYLLARQGRSVLLIERGESPGAKNLSGGVLYSRTIESVFPEFLTEAPIERRITRNQICFLNRDGSVAVDYQDARLSEPVNAVTVLRAKLDAWLAEQCTGAGALVMPGVRVDEALVEHADGGDWVVGVQAGEDQLRARVVIAADGVNSFIARGLGLRAKPPMHHLAVGIKGVLALPRTVLEDRFNLSADEGAALGVVGDCTRGVGGGGFCYTNLESVSVGVVLRLDDLVAKKQVASEIFEHFLEHPVVARYLKDGELLEYGCHLVAEGGLEMVGDIAMNGMVVVGDAAGLTLNTGLTVRGMDLAVGSAVAAASAVGRALDSRDASAYRLGHYRELLFASNVGKDMQTYAAAPGFLESERLYGQYGELLARVLYGAFSIDGRPKEHLAKMALNAFTGSGLGIGRVVGDAIAGIRAL